MAGLSTLIGQAVLGWLLADLITGAFHWWEDRYGRVEWPIIGSWLIEPNRLHHASPLAFTRHGFMARNRASMLLGAIVWAAWCEFSGPNVMLAAVCLGGALSNEVHRFAHQPACAPGWIRVAQQIGVLQSPKEHAAHHRPSHLQNYCVLTDWLNPVLEAVHFWRALELLVGAPRKEPMQ